MMEYSFPTGYKTISSIAKPTLQAYNFEIKPAIIQIIRSTLQFSDLRDEDPNKHLANFLDICNSFKFNSLDRESLYNVWEHFNNMLRNALIMTYPCDNRYNFLQWVTLANRTTIDAAADGTS
ncbi:UNVERIFIED_CONTAM: hypothetical protein Sindi_2685400 [Sesamum indicum]